MIPFDSISSPTAVLLDAVRWTLDLASRVPGLVGDAALGAHDLAVRWGTLGGLYAGDTGPLEGFPVRGYAIMAVVILVCGTGALVYGIRERRRAAARSVTTR